MTDIYVSMLIELKRRRDRLMAELSGVNAAIEGIAPLVPSDRPVSTVVSSPGQAVQPQPPPPARQETGSGNYSRISVRWAALWHLAEFAPGPMRNGEIADAILAGGYHSGATLFPNAVSAVLSGMRAKGEIAGTPEGGYSLTDKGKQIWQAIRHSERFRSVTAPSRASEPLLLSVQ